MKHRKLLSTLIATSMTISVVGNIAPTVFADTLEDYDEIVVTDEESSSEDEIAEVSDELIEETDAIEEAVQEINEETAESGAVEEISEVIIETAATSVVENAEAVNEEAVAEIIEAPAASEPVAAETDNVEVAEAPEVEEVKEAELPLFCEETTVNGILITVKADRGVFPVGSYIAVTPVNDVKANALVSESRDDNVNVAYSMTFDITVYNAEGIEIEPDNSKGNVYVSFKDTRVADNNLDVDVYHITDNKAVELTSEVDEDTVVAVTDSFSYYTVEFTYDSLEYVLDGDSTVALSVILDAVGLEGEVSAVSVSDESLFYAYNESGVWYICANQAFNTEEWMKVTIAGTEYEIVVTDDNTSAATVAYYARTTGYDIQGVNPTNSTTISTTFGDNGYKTQMSVEGGSKTSFGSYYGDSFAFGKEFGTDEVKGKVTASLAPAGNAVIVTYTVTNYTDEAKSVRIGSSADTQVGGDDSAAVSLTSNGVKMRSYNGNEFYLIPGNGDFTTRWTGYYSDAYSNVFNNATTYQGTDSDSGIAFSWTIIVPANRSVTRTAVFAAGNNLTTYTISFNANGGSGTMNDATFISDVPGSIPECEFTRDGYTFMGWAESADSTTVVYEDQGQVTVTSNKQLYAVWLESSVVVVPPTAATGLVFDGSEKTLLATPGSCENGTMQYSIDSVTWTDTIPAKTNAGTYTVYYKGHGDGNNYGDSAVRSLSVTIAKAPTAIEDLEYTGEPQQLVNPPENNPDGFDMVEYSVDGGETWTNTPPTGTDAGDYEVYVRYTDTNNNHVPNTFTGGPVIVTIDPMPAPDKETLTEAEIPTAVDNPDFTGDVLDLVEENKEFPENYDEVYYSIDGGKTWTNEIPSTDAAGKFVINVKYVDSNGNHEEFRGEDIIVNVAIPKNPTRFGYDFEGWFADEDCTIPFDPAALEGNETAPAYADWAVVTYTLIEGTDLTVTSGSDEGATFRAVRNRNETTTFSHYTYVTVDEVKLNEDEYSKRSGSIIIELDPDYIAKLTPGEHTIEIFFDDSYSVKTTFVLSAPADVPSTGETINYAAIAAAGMLIAMAGTCAVIAVVTRKKEEKQ